MRTALRVGRSPWWELVRIFLTLGALSPSGPGLTGVLQTEVQEKRGWLSQARFVEGVALVNMLPGPGGAQLRPYLEKILPRQRGVEGLDWGFRLFCHPSSA